jgi:choline dehydrogenase
MGIRTLLLFINCILFSTASVSWDRKVTLAETVMNYLKEGSEAVKNFVMEGTKHFQEEPQDQKSILPEYDFIIVGAGSAGSVLANRLSEIPDWKVLLVEAGGKENFVMDIPLLLSPLQFSEANWKYKLEPSGNTCLAMKGKQCTVPRGKVMGGSSTINFMIYTRGGKHDYNRWEKLGNPGWGYKDVLPYFLKLENMTIPELKKDDRYHSTRGELPISYAPYHTPLADAFLEAGKEMGHRIVDYNGETQVGFSYVQATMKNGTRCSASRAFLHPIRSRKNLHVKKWSLVTNILIDHNTKTAYGVEFIRDKKKYIVRARKEVIVSGGAINSPQLLMLSGIGPAEHLSELGIPLVQDLKVGYNLMDHIGMMTVSFVLNQSVALRERDLLDGRAFMEYMSYHTGPFSIPGATDGIAYYDSKNPYDPDGDPDLEFMLTASSLVSERFIHKALAVREDIYVKAFKPIEEFHTWTGIPIVLRPKSRGRILLKSRNAFDKPRIYFDFFQESADMEILLSGVKKILQLSRTQAFQKYGSRLHDISIPGCEHLNFGSDDYWLCVLRNFAFPIWHLSGTCKMGPPTDRNAVVDSRLRVYGVKRLRVIDSSIMPVLPAAHTNAPTMMTAEKGADYIKQDWGLNNSDSS